MAISPESVGVEACGQYSPLALTQENSAQELRLGGM
jgi:hypothetical protein